MRYFYASDYRNANIDSLPITGEGKQIRRFLTDLSYINTRKEELVLLKAHRGTKNAPNSFNRQLDLKFFGIPIDAEPDPAYFGFDINSLSQNKETAKEQMKAYLDSKDGYGNKAVIGNYKYASDDEKKRILDRYSDFQDDKNEGLIGSKSKEQLKDERYEKYKQIKQQREEDGKMHFGAMAKTELGYRAGCFANKHQNGMIVKMLRFFQKFGLIILKVGFWVLLFFLLLNLGLYIGGTISSVGETPFAICNSGNSDNHQPIAYKLSLNSDFRRSIVDGPTFFSRYLSGAEFIGENLLESNKTKIIKNGHIKIYEKDGKTYNFALPVDQSTEKNVHHNANITDLSNKDPQIDMNRICIGFDASKYPDGWGSGYGLGGGTDEEKCQKTLKEMYENGMVSDMSFMFGQNGAGEFIRTKFLDHPDYIVRNGNFNSFEGNDYSIRMRWEFMNYDIGEDGSITNQTPASGDDINVYKEWLKSQRIVVFNPSNKKYVVLKIDTSGTEEENNVSINWGPTNVNRVGSISEAAATYLGYGADESGNSRSDNMMLAFYWVPDDTSVGPVDVPNKEYNACRTNGSSAGLVSEGEYIKWKQCDSAWGGDQLGNSSSHTICSAGCAMTSVTIMLAKSQVQLNIPEALTPASFNSTHRSNGGFDGASIYWDVTKESNGQITMTSGKGWDCGNDPGESAKIAQFSEWLTNGYMPVVQVKGCMGDGATHYVFVDAVVDNQLMIIDPGGGPAEPYNLSDKYDFHNVTQVILYKVKN